MDALDTTNDDNDANDTMDIYNKIQQQQSHTTSTDGIYAGQGENKVIVNKKSKRKQKRAYRMKGMIAVQKQHSTKDHSTTTIITEKKRPKFYCSFT